MFSFSSSVVSRTSFLVKKRPLLMAFLSVVNSLTLRKPKKATVKAACSMSRSWVESDFFECRDLDRSLSIFMVSGCLIADPDPAACFLWSPLRASLSLGFPVTGLQKPFEWWRCEMAARYTLIVFTLNVLLRWAANRATECLLAGHGHKWSCSQNAKNFSIPTL